MLAGCWLAYMLLTDTNTAAGHVQPQPLHVLQLLSTWAAHLSRDEPGVQRPPAAQEFDGDQLLCRQMLRQLYEAVRPPVHMWLGVRAIAIHKSFGVEQGCTPQLLAADKVCAWYYPHITQYQPTAVTKTRTHLHDCGGQLKPAEASHGASSPAQAQQGDAFAQAA